MGAYVMAPRREGNVATSERTARQLAPCSVFFSRPTACYLGDLGPLGSSLVADPRLLCVDITSDERYAARTASHHFRRRELPLRP
jgi:hypothetical protein